MTLLRVFISSPGDVAQERAVARRVLGRVQGAYAGRVALEPVLWEQQPLLATDTFQAQIVRPSACDIVLAVLWSRIGTPLPDTIRRPDGRRYRSGTEFEIEDALEAARAHGRPRVLLYRKTAASERWYADASEALDAAAQREGLEAFIAGWTRDARDGSFRAAFHPFASTAEFEELVELHLHRLVRELVPGLGDDAAPGAATWTFGSPFRGLASFELEHAPLFFGRTAAIAAAVEKLKAQARRGTPFLLLLGMSGGGKSSLAKAGVLPMLMQPGVVEEAGTWRWAVLRPGEGRGDLTRALAHALCDPAALPALGDAGAFAHALRDAPVDAAARVREMLARAPGGAHLALVVDQLEEMFTDAGVDDDGRRRFVAALDALVRQGVWTIATLRSDFYPRIAELPGLVALKEGGQFDVGPPGPAEIAQMIRMPAAAAGLRFEQDAATGERLDERLRDVMAGRAAALPLLQFTLEELYQRRRADGVLTLAAYDEIGGLEGALAHRAEGVFAAQPADVQDALPAVLEPLVAAGDDDEGFRRRHAAWSAFADERVRRLAQALIDARLLATDLASDGTVQIAVAHEALLRHWPRAVAWLRDNRELLRIRERVRAAAARWAQEERRGEYLLQAGKPLDEAVALRDSGARLEPLERAFIEQSNRRRERNRRVRQGAIAALAVLAVTATAAAVIAVRQAELAQREATTASRTSEFLASLFAVADPGEDRGNRVTARELLDRGAAQIRTELRDEPLVRAGLMSTMGVAYSGLGLYDEALRLTAEAGEERARYLGPAHPDTLRTRAAHAVALYQAGEYERAEAAFRDVRRSIGTAFAPEDAERVRVDIGLADVLTAAGKPEEAQALYEDALRAAQAGRGDRRRERAYALAGLGLAHYFQGRLDEAQARFGEARALGEEALGATHPKVLECANNLASIAYQKGDYARARALWDDMLPRYRAVYGPEHAEVATVLNNLGRVALIERRFEDAIRHLDEALALDRRYKGPRHDDLILPLNNLGLARMGLGRHDRARRDLDEALAIAREHRHWMVGVVLTYVADLELRTGALDAAERSLREARQALEAAFPPGEHKDEAWRYDLLAGLEAALGSQRGRHADAEAALVAGVERMAARFGEHSLYAVDALHRAVQHFQRAGDPARTASYQQRLARAERGAS
jgi:tetratricopeptide (TPR) repeat protein